jgi:hypothetical protein
LYCFIQDRAQFFSGIGVLRVLIPNCDLPGHYVLTCIDRIIQRYSFVRAPLSQLHQRFVYRNADQPCVKLRIALKVIEVRIGLQERFLQNVLSVFFVLSNLLCHPEHTSIIVIDQICECRLIAGFGPHYQGRFVEGWLYA